jgi:hypothetical protein
VGLSTRPWEDEAMTEPELDAILQQYPGWVAIERLVATIRQERIAQAGLREVIHQMQQTLRLWYNDATVPRQRGETDEGHRARTLALKNATIIALQIMQNFRGDQDG